MDTNEKPPKDKSPQSQTENPQAPPVTGTTELYGISDLTVQLKKLIEKLDAPKRKDLWDIVAVLTTLTGTVIMAGISLYVTQSYQRQEAQRTREYQEHESARAAQFNQSQIEIQRAQVRVEELKAITALAPLLASSDIGSRETGKQLLQAIHDTGAPDPSAASAGASDLVTRGASKPPPSLLDQFAKIALSSAMPARERVAATQKIGEIATAPSTPPAVRERAADIAAQIATSKETPPEVQQAAAEVISKIKQVNAEEAKDMISSQPITRNITEVILHSSYTPTSAYNGAETIFDIANFLLSRHWRNVSWHFAIAPDGSIWLGAPINEQAIHTPRHNQTSVSVLLIMDGDKELPTDAQRTSLVAVLRSLFSRLKIEDAANSPEGSGFHFHRDYALGRKTCPGSLLTKEMVLGWQ